jgi:hypothetical protein
MKSPSPVARIPYIGFKNGGCDLNHSARPGPHRNVNWFIDDEEGLPSAAMLRYLRASRM